MRIGAKSKQAPRAGLEHLTHGQRSKGVRNDNSTATNFAEPDAILSPDVQASDIRLEGGITVMTITPEAGKVKTRRYRIVPLHAQIVVLGFLDFVERSEDGPLFLSHFGGIPNSDRAQTLSGRLATWLQSENLVPHEVSPYHGWRHAFKTTGRECEIDVRILDAIVGHASRTAGDDYGDITIATMKRAIEKFPHFDI